MAGVGMVIGSAVINAISFTGGQKLMSLLGPNPEIERKRHDEANEALNKATVEWNQHQQKRHDFMNERMKKENKAEKDFYDVDDSLNLYDKRWRAANSPSRGREPKLSDHYQPSEQQKNYEYVFIICGVIVTGIFTFKYI